MSHTERLTKAINESVEEMIRDASERAWNEGYAARKSEDVHSPGESNPYKGASPAQRPQTSGAEGAAAEPEKFGLYL